MSFFLKLYINGVCRFVYNVSGGIRVYLLKTMVCFTEHSKILVVGSSARLSPPKSGKRRAEPT
jgi:hypothetical protein